MKKLTALIAGLACALPIALGIAAMPTPPTGEEMIQVGPGAEAFFDPARPIVVTQPDGTTTEVKPEKLSGLTTYNWDVYAQPVPAGTDVFNLSSNAGASKTIYLQFTGKEFTKTIWNNYFGIAQGTYVSGFDLDGDPSTFADKEKKVIYNTWLGVMQDYAWSDVNVTTVRPESDALTRSSSTDDTYGVTAFVSSDLVKLNNRVCGYCSGLAIRGIFDMVENTNPTMREAMIFAVGNSTSDAMSITISHEVGHTLGLSHDGTIVNGVTKEYAIGRQGWSPMMGTGSGNAFKSFDNGSYPNANNKEDDFAVMKSHGLKDVADPEGNSLQTASSKSKGVTTHYLSPSDSDFFRVNHAGGAITFSAVPRWVTIGMNLDLAMELYDANGKLITAVGADAVTTVVPSRTDAAISRNLPAGTYYIRVFGPSHSSGTVGIYAYGNTGYYNLTVA